MRIMLSGITVLAVMLTVFSGCYQEVELDPRQPGDLALVAGAYNVRDLGGYTALGGKTVKTGKLFRSGDLNLLTSRDQNYLFNEIGIKTVVDFRSARRVVDVVDSDDPTVPAKFIVSTEQEKSPDRVPNGVTKISVNTAINESIVVPDYESIISDTTLDIQRVIAEVAKGYRRIVLGIEEEQGTPNAKT
ncbi:MAG: tyrosine-protein phosphatase, partial [Treponema sp.]|nr:tyrosine-protein phosphatase [Treponema sp.]